METVRKSALLDRLEKRVELHLNEAVMVFQNLPEKVLLKPSPSGGWSIAQCLEHLNTYGHYYLPEIRKGLEKQKGQPSSEEFTSTWFGSYFTRMMEPETGKKKYKAFKNYIPLSDLNAYGVVAEFIEQQELLLKYIKTSRGVDLNRVKVPISIFKWVKLRLGDVFQFLIAHNERHLVQAKRNLV